MHHTPDTPHPNLASQLEDERTIMQTAQTLKALASPPRLSILLILSDGQERAVSEINQLLKLSQSALSQHLAVLRASGVVRTRRAAQSVFYSITDMRTLNVLRAAGLHVPPPSP